jgi:hypothetical protein
VSRKKPEPCVYASPADERLAQIVENHVRERQLAEDRKADREARRVNPRDDLSARFSGVPERRSGRLVDMLSVQKEEA